MHARARPGRTARLRQRHPARGALLFVGGQIGWNARQAFDSDEYNARLQDIGIDYREVMGRNFPAMTCVQVVAVLPP